MSTVGPLLLLAVGPLILLAIAIHFTSGRSSTNGWLPQMLRVEASVDIFGVSLVFSMESSGRDAMDCDRGGA